MHDRNYQRKVTMCANDEYQRTSNKKCIVDIVDIVDNQRINFVALRANITLEGVSDLSFFPTVDRPTQ